LKIKVVASILACFLLFSMAGSSQPSEKPSVINIMIDADMPAMASEEQGQEASYLLRDIYNLIGDSNGKATIFSTQDLVRSYTKLRLTYLGRQPNIELAFSGNHSGEKLSNESLSDQRAILKTSKEYVERCRVCGVNEISASGFLPQSFDQNENTYKVLDELGVVYNAGFQAGIIYAPGHKEDVWPYKLDGYKFYAVPLSTYELSDQRVPLQDRYFVESGFSSSQWYDALEQKFIEVQEKDEPMVVLLTKSVSGSGEYFDALKEFLDFATSNSATFVTTMELVNMSLEEGYELPIPASGECTTCGQKDEGGNVSIGLMGNATD